MPAHNDTNSADLRNPNFPRTQWSMVLSAGHGSQERLSEFYAQYQYPLYAYARRVGHSKEDARDLLQSFFLRSIEREDFSAADPSRGRFRSWLLTAFRHYLANSHRYRRAQKRGGSIAQISIDQDGIETRYSCEPVDSTTPEKLFERSWVRTLLLHVMESLEAEHACAGKLPLFNALRSLIVEKSGDYPYA